MEISQKNKMHQQPMLFCEIFDVWGIDFIGSFPVSYRNSYILLDIDYVSRWVEAKATKTNDAKVVIDFLKSHIFCKFGVPKALSNDKGSHFCNRAMATLLEKYGVELDELRFEAYENSRIYKEKDPEEGVQGWSKGTLVLLQREEMELIITHSKSMGIS
ncbi:pol, partial [Mucuna pruriens]